MSYKPENPIRHNDATAKVVYTERQGRIKRTYYDDGIVKITRYKAKRKIYWGRITVALIVFILLIMGIVQLVKVCAEAIKNDSNQIKVNNNMPEMTTVSQADSVLTESEVESSESTADSDSQVTEYSSVNLTVCLDAAHGGNDVGTTASDGTTESSQNLEFALLVEDYLESCGVTVVMTRDSDVQISTSERCIIANQAEADFYVSIHRNSVSDGSDTSGVEAWVHNSEPQYDTTLAINILSELEQVGVSNNLGVNYGYSGIPTDNYPVNTDTVMPSCLIQLGYMTSDNDNLLFETNKEQYAEAVGKAIIKTAQELGVIDKNGQRLIDEQLISDKSNVTE